MLSWEILTGVISKTTTMASSRFHSSKDHSSKWFKETRHKLAAKTAHSTIPAFPKPKMPVLPTKYIWFCFGLIFSAFVIFVPYNIYLFLSNLPNPELLNRRFIPVTTQIFDRNGTILYEIHGDEDRKPIELETLPEYVKQATIAIEDKDFYRHPGFSVRGILRAAVETLLRKNLQGGSTITQQLIKNALLSSEVSIWRKIREVVLAFWAEKLYSKDDILEMYLNQVPYGGTTWGIEAAAKRYFGKSAKDVTLAEAAFLAGLPAAPTSYSPYGDHPDLARTRQREVLAAMLAQRYISQDQANEAANVELQIQSNIENIRAPHFVTMIRNLLNQKFGQLAVDQGGLRVKTSLDLQLQEKTQQIVASNVAQLKKLQVGNGAALVSDPKNGDILAMVGSKDYFNTADDGNVNVTMALRQPGSSIKVVNYAAGLENGMTPITIIDDSPVSYVTPGQPPYAPVNYDGRYHGAVTFRSALANSYNIPAVKILNKIGVKTMITMGKRMGIDSWGDESRFGLALTLGGGEVTMWDMNEVYGTLANQGNRVDLDPLLEVTDYTGRVYYRKNPTPVAAIAPSVAYMISDILADNGARTPAFGPNSQLKIPNKFVSVKTGTTNDKRDNWTVGYTPSYVVGVWVGNNNNSPMNPYLTSGVTGAAPIWNQIMSELLKNKSDEKQPQPDSVITVQGCLGRTEYFVKGTEPRGGCPRPVAPSPQPSP